jgi:hypothetical protein
MFLAQEREGALIAPVVVLAENADDEKGDLPPMEDLVKRIPPAARELMEQLFRPHFVTVKRIPLSALKK